MNCPRTTRFYAKFILKRSEGLSMTLEDLLATSSINNALRFIPCHRLLMVSSQIAIPAKVFGHSQESSWGKRLRWERGRLAVWPDFVVGSGERAQAKPSGERARRRPLQAGGLRFQSAAKGCPFDSQDMYFPKPSGHARAPSWICMRASSPVSWRFSLCT